MALNRTPLRQLRWRKCSSLHRSGHPLDWSSRYLRILRTRTMRSHLDDKKTMDSRNEITSCCCDVFLLRKSTCGRFGYGSRFAPAVRAMCSPILNKCFRNTHATSLTYSCDIPSSLYDKASRSGMLGLNKAVFRLVMMPTRKAQRDTR